MVTSNTNYNINIKNWWRQIGVIKTKSKSLVLILVSLYWIRKRKKSINCSEISNWIQNNFKYSISITTVNKNLHLLSKENIIFLDKQKGILTVQSMPKFPFKVIKNWEKIIKTMLENQILVSYNRISILEEMIEQSESELAFKSKYTKTYWLNKYSLKEYSSFSVWLWKTWQRYRSLHKSTVSRFFKQIKGFVISIRSFSSVYLKQTIEISFQKIYAKRQLYFDKFLKKYKWKIKSLYFNYKVIKHLERL
ncbi:Uncharacterised protein [Mesomycoplasma conjunctivae]|uniref:Uncharacterized protein n=1 Tax=Mesomycoplasma conjunctivae (strain ATCC 25834 / NCTC 10147 / HRC/581) TaxID=572263 RepID=C5J6F5_MESCH|nr:hypothetical protein [Mesomycoplasma conjunctivae]CAT05047.1 HYPOTHETICAL PROTEIN MCJ_003580 [Mesomycoplasma conjunctivae]VEU66295.1 Uncharacterised protein [Mesomycoplasma conjunctivae]